jgi:hypothetical protein
VRCRCCAHRHCLWPRCCTRRWPTAIWLLTVWPRQRWCFFGIALVSLPALHWHHHQHQAVLVTGVVAKLAFKSPAGAVLAFAGIVLVFCLHCAGVIASIVLLLLLPALRRRHCPCCVGTFALLRWHHCPRRLCVVASIANWHLPSHEAVATCAGVIASIAPSSLLALHRHCHPCCAGIFALVALASLPSSHLHCRQHHKLASVQS